VINPWVEKLPKDVNFKRVPAMFGGPWDAHGQMFLTLEAMGVEHKVHAGVRCHPEPAQAPDRPEDMADFLATQGVDKDKFLATFNSFAIKGQINQAKELAKKYEITGVPSMVVNGKYRFDLGTAGGPEGVLNVADQLIDKERAAK
jgi:thiol:disulfide interchange protein DsbA